MTLREVVVTGASRGIGAATAVAAGERGAHVHLLARTESALQETATDVRAAGGEATVHPVDLSDSAATLAVADRIEETHGPPDLLVNNAGTGDWKSLTEMTPQEMRDIMAVPFFAAFDLTWALLPGMVERGSGRVAFVTSPAAFVAVPGATGYAASRAAVRGFADAVRADLQSTDVGVTLVVPGVIDTAYLERNVRERLPPGSDLRVPSPAEMGTAIIDGVEAGRSLVVKPLEYRFLLAADRLAPGLLRRVVNRTGYQLDEDDWRRESAAEE